MRPRPIAVAGPLCALAVLVSTCDSAVAQIGVTETIGQFYKLEPPVSAERFFDAVQIERVAPHALAPPAPIAPLRLAVPLRALTGQIFEVPERQRIYVTALDAGSAVRLFEIDLLSREAREVRPPIGVQRPYAAHFLAAPDASKLYVQWFASGALQETYIYDGETLDWVGRTTAFRPDERAAGFEHRPPFLWTLDLADRPVLLDTQRDRIVHTFERNRLLGPVRGVTADAWRDLVLVRLDAGHDRFRLVDIVSGEVGPPLDLEGYRQAQARLVLDGRFLVLVERERRPRRRRAWRQTAIATGAGEIYDLRTGRLAAEFRLIVPHELPVAAFGAHTDPALPGRLWVHVPGDDQRFDFELPSCDRGAPRGGRLEVSIEASWDRDGDRDRYRYRVQAAAASEAAIGAFAIKAGRETERPLSRHGWGADYIGRERWVRWSNGLGPPDEDIAPGEAAGGFEIVARPDARPGIAEYRVRAATGLPRGCERDDRFLENGVVGYTIAPESVRTTDPRKRAQRLERMVARACEIGWIDEAACPSLRAAAAAIVPAKRDRVGAVTAFEGGLAAAALTGPVAAALQDAAAAVREASEP